MTFGELVAALMGWLGEFVQFVASFVPRVKIVRANERGVRYRMGDGPTEVTPGLTWYWPWQTSIVVHHVARCVLELRSVSLETSDGVKVQVGMVVTYHITDVVKYEVDNFDTESSMAEQGIAALRQAIMKSRWDEIREEAHAAELLRHTQEALEKFGVEVESARATDLVRLGDAVRLFGVDPKIVVDFQMVRPTAA